MIKQIQIIILKKVYIKIALSKVNTKTYNQRSRITPLDLILLTENPTAYKLKKECQNKATSKFTNTWQAYMAKMKLEIMELKVVVN